MVQLERFLLSFSLTFVLLFSLQCDSNSGGSSELPASQSTISAALSGDGALTAQAPSSLSIVPNNSQLSSSLSGELAQPAVPLRKLLATDEISNALASLPETNSTDYEIDQTEMWSMDPTKERFREVDQLLKLLNVLGYEYVYGRGPVIVRFDENALNNMGTSNGGSNQAKRMMEVTVVSSLSEGNNLPLTVEAWTSQEDSFGPTDLSMKVIVYEPPSPENRFGKFEAWQKATMSFNGNSFSQERYIKVEKTSTGLLELSIVDSYGDINYNGKYWAIAQVNDQAQTGQILMGDSNSDAECSSSGFINYNQNYVYQNYQYSYPKSEGSGCETNQYETLSDRANIRTEVWSYGLYDQATQSRKALRTGMMVETEDGQYEGWASEWGLYMYPKQYDPSNTGMYTVSDGDKLKEVTYDGSVGETFTAKVQNFNVDQRITVATPLDDIDGLALQLNTYDQLTNSSTYFEVKWDKTQKKFMQTKSGTTFSNLSELTPPVEHFETRQYSKWNQSSSTNEFYLAEVTYNYTAQQTEVKRYCKRAGSEQNDGCDSDGWLTPGSTTTFKDLAGYDGWPLNLWMQEPAMSGQPKTYVWRSDNPTTIDIAITDKLRNVNSDLILVNINEISSGCYSSFYDAQDYSDSDEETVSYSPTIDGHVYKLDTGFNFYKCDDNDCNTSTAITTGQVYNQQTFQNEEKPFCTDTTNTSGCATAAYYHELVAKSDIPTVTITASSEVSRECEKFRADRFATSYSANKSIYNQTVVFMQGNQPFVFDTPMKFTKVVNGKSYDFEYGGFGQLWIPWQQLDPTCTPDMTTMCDYGPAFTLANGDILSHKNADGVTTNYLVKQLFGSEIMAKLDVSTTPNELKQVPTLSYSVESAPALEIAAKPQATKTCIIEGQPVDKDGNPLSSITGDNAASFCQ